MPTPIIIDCDPGVDDAIALLLAFASPELDILGVTTVAGNVGAVMTARNAAMIREIAGREDVPVLAGAATALLRESVEAGHFHGVSGFGAIEPFEPRIAAATGHAVTFIVDTVMAHPASEVTIVATGPLTNIAMAMRLEPALAARLSRLVVMGGARVAGGNITPSAEFNVFADPHAAQIVFASGCEIVVAGLDATHQVRATEARIAAIEALPTPAARTAAALLRFSQSTERRLVGGDAAPLHDPCTIAWLLRPDLFETRPCRIEVETASPLTLGHTAVEFRVDAATTHWITSADADGVFTLLTERASRT